MFCLWHRWELRKCPFRFLQESSFLQAGGQWTDRPFWQCFQQKWLCTGFKTAFGNTPQITMQAGFGWIYNCTCVLCIPGKKPLQTLSHEDEQEISSPAPPSHLCALPSAAPPQHLGASSSTNTSNAPISQVPSV